MAQITATLRPAVPRAHILTGLRLLCAVAIGAIGLGEAISPDERLACLALAGIGLVLDGLDGAVARRDGTASPFGAWFDQEVDGLLVLCLSILAWRSGAAGPWVLLAGAWRYLFIALRAALPRLRGALPFSQRRRVICVVQIVGLMICAAPFVPATLSWPVAALTVLALSASFLTDLLRLWAQDSTTP